MDYTASHFHTLSTDENIFRDVVATISCRLGAPENILDIGCASGQILDSILEKQMFNVCSGIDLSLTNVVEAQKRLEKYDCTRLDIIAGDYIQSSFEPSQVVISSGTLHLIPTPFETLCAKIRNDVASGGYLIFSVPIDCPYNKALLLVRRTFRACDCSAIRSFVAWCGHICYPSFDKAMLRERVPYMFMIPIFLFGKKEDICLQEYGFTPISKIKMPFFLGKLIHNCFVYEKK